PDRSLSDHLVVVVLHEREQLVAYLDSLPLASQRSLLIADQDEVPGTGRATECALTQLPEDISGTVVVTSGDVPLLTTETINDLVGAHGLSSIAVTGHTCVAQHQNGHRRQHRSSSH